MERLLTTNELAECLQVKPSTIRAWVLRRRITCVKLAGGRAVRYRQSDFEKMIKTGLRPALRQSPETQNTGQDDAAEGGAA